MRHIVAGTLSLVLLCTAALAQAPDAAGTAAAPASSSSQATSGGINAVLAAAKSRSGNGDDFLPPDEAFRFDALAAGSDRVRLNWQIADGYYLYRARIKVATTGSGVQLGATQFPAGQVKNDEYFGRQEIYHHELSAVVPVTRARGGALDLPLQ
ncbi:MAG TPA: protein-disulfide reductase DsbD domain-containing protein, partial [Steroidobacteraceae bacterium]|nr:protein-disulfide reductase DsbD domain-containing protein [Steroidobacteraceae bacterium]